MLIYKSDYKWNTCDECGINSKEDSYRILLKQETTSEIHICRKCLRELMKNAYETLMDG